MPAHLTKFPNGAALPATAPGLEDGVPFLETTNGRLFYVSSELYTPVIPRMQMPRVDYAAAHTLTATDLSQRLRFTASATLTLPADATEDLDLDVITQVFAQTGPLTVAGEGGVTLINNGGSPYATGTTLHLVKDAADTWVIY